MYSVFDYGSMIADRVRMDSYVQALRQNIRPDSVVLDIGTGTGIFALLACQLGARRVYAIEPDDAIQVAREIAVSNGYAKSIEFIQNLSTEVTLPERVNVIVSDLGGLLPWFKNHIPSIIDARRRFLAPDGVLIPRVDTVWAAVVQASEFYGQFTEPWDDRRYGLDMDPARRIVVNTWRRGRLTSDHLLLNPQRWATLDYSHVVSPDIRANLTWTVAREGTAHGLAIWFDRTLAEGVHLSNAPGVPETDLPVIYSTVFFPWSKPVALGVGDTVLVTLQARLIGGDYSWCWNTCVHKHGDPRKIEAEFKQSNFFGLPLSPGQLQKQACSYLPTLNENGEIDRFILDSMDGRTSLGDIANSITARYSSRFPTYNDALTRIGELSTKYSRS
jgi:protein arginine N-methyltransferase 1